LYQPLRQPTDGAIIPLKLAGAVLPLHGLDISANCTYLDDLTRSPGADVNHGLARRPAGLRMSF
jgi:hypothetical protein